MDHTEIVNKINNALQNIEMSDEIRVLLIELRDDFPSARTTLDKMELISRWCQILSPGIHLIFEMLPHK